MMYGEGPHPHHGRQHHLTPLCWSLMGAAAYDLHYVIVLRVAIAYYHFTCVVGSASYGLCITSWLRIYSAYLQYNTLLQSRVSVFGHAFLIFGIQVLFTAFAHIKDQQSGVRWCCLPWWGCGALPVHHHLVVQNGILGLYFVFVFGSLFLIFRVLSLLVQKTRLTSSLHFFK